MVQYIFTIRKQHSVNKVHTLRYSVSKISEYKSRCFFFYYFVIYCAANHGIWCSDKQEYCMKMYFNSLDIITIESNGKETIRTLYNAMTFQTPEWQ